MTVRIAVDAARCTGHGRCYSVAPDLLEDDDEGFVTLGGSEQDVPDHLVGQAEEAVAACPERAITLIR